MLPKLSLVLGGASSGKSAYAESLVKSFRLSKHYLATAQILDDEMRDKVEIHKSQRGSDWTLHEAPLDLEATLAQLTENDTVLIDCATMWLSNLMMGESDPSETTLALISAISDCSALVVIVSNEVGHGIVPQNALARSFRQAQGKLNIDLAQKADLVIQVTAGLPNVLKGTLP